MDILKKFFIEEGFSCYDFFVFIEDLYFPVNIGVQRDLVVFVQGFPNGLGLRHVDGQRISNGPIESVNSRIKVIKQNGNGYRNFECFKLRVLYSLNDNSSIKI